MRDIKDVKLWLRIDSQNPDDLRRFMLSLSDDVVIASRLGFVIGPNAAMRYGADLVRVIRGCILPQAPILSQTWTPQNQFEAKKVFETALDVGLIPVFSATCLQHDHLSSSWIPDLAMSASVRWFVEFLEALEFTPSQEKRLANGANGGGVIVLPDCIAWAREAFPRAYRIANFVGQTFLATQTYRIYGGAEAVVRAGAHAILLSSRSFEQATGGEPTDLPPDIIRSLIEHLS